MMLSPNKGRYYPDITHTHTHTHFELSRLLILFFAFLRVQPGPSPQIEFHRLAKRPYKHRDSDTLGLFGNFYFSRQVPQSIPLPQKGPVSNKKKRSRDKAAGREHIAHSPARGEKERRAKTRMSVRYHSTFSLCSWPFSHFEPVPCCCPKHENREGV